MKRNITYLKPLLFVFVLMSIFCDSFDEQGTTTYLCEIQNPTENILWLKEAIDEVRNDQFSYYSTAIYQGQRVFFYTNCDPTVNYISFVQNCAGENLGNTTEFFDNLKEIEVIWKHKDSKCTF